MTTKTKFNLKNYQKISGDEHIERRLQDTHVKEQNEINEAQLEKARATEPTQITEKQLEEKRTGEATEVTERRLDNVKADFNITFRNSEAYDGDMNKLEEKRLLGDPVEKEKYEAASQKPKAFRWWETKTNDGFKLAKKNITKIAQFGRDFGPSEEEIGAIEPLDVDKPRFVDIPSDEDDPYGAGAKIGDVAPEDVSDDATDIGHEPKPMSVKKNKAFKSPDGSNMYYVAFDYDKEDYGEDISRIKRDGLTNILLAQPTLKNHISEEDVVVDEGQEDDLEGTVFIRYVEDISTPEESFVEISYDQKDIGGTSTATGIIAVEGDVTPKNREQIINDAIAFIKERHEGVEINKESLDISDIEDTGEIRYMAGIPQVGIPQAGIAQASSEEFPIIFADQNTKKK